LLGAGGMACAPPSAAMPHALLDELEEELAPPAGGGGHDADPVRALLALQSADGWFDRGGDDPLAAALRRFGQDPAARLDAARRMVAPATGPAEDPDRVARTLLVLALLNDHFHRDNALWRRAGRKALRYLQQALGRDGAGVKRLVEAARETPPTVP